LESLPLTDSVIAIADQSYFDWPELPEAPSEVNARKAGNRIELTWKVHEGHPDSVSVERRIGWKGPWKSVAKLPASKVSVTDPRNSTDELVFYRVQALNGAGHSAYSNVAPLTR
jgi:hypothetical protein